MIWKAVVVMTYMLCGIRNSTQRGDDVYAMWDKEFNSTYRTNNGSDIKYFDGKHRLPIMHIIDILKTSKISYHMRKLL